MVKEFLTMSKNSLVLNVAFLQLFNCYDNDGHVLIVICQSFIPEAGVLISD